jgi:DNA-binding response OmpR family regulator
VTILIVDDEPAVAEMFQVAFESRGHACLVASSLEEADWILSVAAVDAVTLDLSLPDGDAVTWLASLAEVRPDLAARTTIVTGRFLTPFEEARAAACGATALMKPVGVPDLLGAVLPGCDPSSGRARRDSAAHN